MPGREPANDAALRRRLRGIKVAHGGDEYVVLSFDALPHARFAELTEIERTIVEMVVAGRSNVEIARARGRAPSTIQNQLSAIYRKLGVASRAELMARVSGSR